jgi:Co/Zn/Cd efflux system component
MNRNSVWSSGSGRYPAIRRVLIVSAGLHVTIAILKAVYGWKTHSVGMIADGFHSGIQHPFKPQKDGVLELASVAS